MHATSKGLHANLLSLLSLKILDPRRIRKKAIEVFFSINETHSFKDTVNGCSNSEHCQAGCNEDCRNMGPFMLFGVALSFLQVLQTGKGKFSRVFCFSLLQCPCETLSSQAFSEVNEISSTPKNVFVTSQPLKKVPRSIRADCGSGLTRPLLSD